MRHKGCARVLGVVRVRAVSPGRRCLGTPRPGSRTSPLVGAEYGAWRHRLRSSSKALGRLGYRCTDTCVATCWSIAVTSGTVTANSAARRPRMSVVRAAGPGRASLKAARRLPFDTMSPHPLETRVFLYGDGACLL